MKTDRLLAIAMLLLYRRTTTVGELAQQFEVSERTIYRDLSILDCAGFPLISSPGRGGGVGLQHGFGIESRLFSRGSFSLLASTLGALGDLLGDETMEHDARLAAGAGDGSQELVRLDFTSPSYHGLAPVMKTLARAMNDARAVAIEYVGSSGKTSTRTVEPLRLVLWDGDWYLQAWCRLRTEYRLFRLRRILDSHGLAESFDRPARMSTLPAPEFQSTPGPPIVLRVSGNRPDLARRFAAQPAKAGSSFEVTIDWPVNDWLASYLCGLAPEVQAVAPPTLRLQVQERLRTALESYQESREP